MLPLPIGRYLTSLGAVNDYYRLKGVSEKSSAYCTDKHLFHKTLAQQGLRNSEHFLVPCGAEKFSEDISSIHYPVIVKPRFGSGNRAVQVYQNSNELKKQFIRNMPYEEDFIIESCIAGIEYGVDAAIIDGEFYLILLREKLLTPYPYRQCVGYLSVINNNDNSKLINSVIEKISNAGKIIGLEHCLLHADIIFDGQDIFIIEMSARPAGHYLHNIFTPIATGVDMISEYVKSSLPQLNHKYSFKPEYTKCLLIKYFDFSEKHIATVPNKNFICEKYPIKAYECNLEDGVFLHRVTDGHSIMGRGYYIVEGNNRDELIGISNEIERHFITESR